MGEGCARPPDSQETAHTPHAGTQDQTRWTPGPLLAYGRSLRLARLGPQAYLGRDTMEGVCLSQSTGRPPQGGRHRRTQALRKDRLDHGRGNGERLRCAARYQTLRSVKMRARSRVSGEW